MQPDMAKVARLTGRVLVIEKKPDAVRGVVTLGLDLFMREKRNIGIGIAKIGIRFSPKAQVSLQPWRSLNLTA